MASAHVELELDAEPHARVVEQALLPELGRDVPGSRASLRRDGARLLLAIQAGDRGDLRAAVNSYLRWIDLALRVREAAGERP